MQRAQPESPHHAMCWAIVFEMPVNRLLEPYFGVWIVKTNLLVIVFLYESGVLNRCDHIVVLFPYLGYLHIIRVLHTFRDRLPTMRHEVVVRIVRHLGFINLIPIDFILVDSFVFSRWFLSYTAWCRCCCCKCGW